MSTVWSYISSVWISYGPWIGLSLIPTIIAGLSISPKTEGSVVIVQKVWDVIKQVMSIFSIVTFKDKPGTFQLPLKLGSLIKKPSITTSVMLVLMLSSIGCVWFTSTAKEVGNVVLHCAVEEVSERSGELIAVVVAAAGSSSFEQIVEALIEKFGLDVAGCAVLSSKEQVATAVGPTSGPALTVTPTLLENVKKLTKLNSIITSKKWVPGV